MTAGQIELAVINYFDYRQCLIIPNVSWGFGLNYEADLVVVRKSGYAIEVEIKVSRADLIKDKSKKHNHDSHKFKNLYFAIPQKLLTSINDIPARAGVLICSKENRGGEEHYFAKLQRRSISQTAQPLALNERYELARLGAIRIWNLKRKLIKLKNKQEV